MNGALDKGHPLQTAVFYLYWLHVEPVQRAGHCSAAEESYILAQLKGTPELSAYLQSLFHRVLSLKEPWHGRLSGDTSGSKWNMAICFESCIPFPWLRLIRPDLSHRHMASGAPRPRRMKRPPHLFIGWGCPLLTLTFVIDTCLA